MPRQITRHQIHGESGAIPDGEVVASETDGPRGLLTVWVVHADPTDEDRPNDDSRDDITP